MTSTVTARKKIIVDLEHIFIMALESQDFQSAIRAKKLIAKLQGFLDTAVDAEQMNLSQLELHELETLIAQSEQMVTELTKKYIKHKMAAQR